MELDKLSDDELKKEMKKRNLKPNKLVITYNVDDFLYCDKCGAPIDKKGKYKHD